MLPLVPELTAAGFSYVVGVDPDAPAEAVVVSGSLRVRGEVRCRADRLLIGGRIDVTPTQMVLYLGLTEPNATLEFDGLSFGFSVSQGDVELASGQWPRAGQRYISSDQQYLLAAAVNGILPGSVLAVTLWSEDRGQRFESTFRLNAPRPAKPFLSWSWDGGNWQPPIPKPEGQWDWDEAGQQWVPWEPPA